MAATIGRSAGSKLSRDYNSHRHSTLPCIVVKIQIIRQAIDFASLLSPAPVQRKIAMIKPAALRR
jgi:hypothetical protein